MIIRTLIVDDEPLARKKIRTFLAAERDFEVVGECSDGEQAIAAIEKTSPDLVFLDVQMPGSDGFSVIEGVGAQKMPPTVFVTAFDQYAVRAFDFHAVDYLLKPFDRARFTIPGRKEDGPFNALCGTIFNGIDRISVRNQDNGQINRTGNRRNSRVGFDTVNFFSIGMDGINTAGIFLIQERYQKELARFESPGQADDGDGCGMKNLIELSDK